MKRREFIILLGGTAAAWPMVARTQQADRRRIGVLVSGTENDPEMLARLGGFQQGLARFGWSEGRNVRVDYRFAAGDADRAHELGSELISLKPDVLVALATQPTKALQKQTRTIPIVFSGVIDPVGAGLITSLAKPGGNLTGTLLYEESIVGKWLGMLKEISPTTARVAVLTNPNTSSQAFNQAAKVFAPSLAIELVPFSVEAAADIERAIESFARVPNGGLLVLPDLTLVTHRDLVIALVARYRLPSVYQARFWVAAGGLMSYGTDRIVASRQVAYYVDSILRGEHPTDLPVQGPTKFETTLNLRTANALGLTVPSGLLVAADEVIE
jgi:ABC-type uncharacterized transport system substrate-binding protein